MDASNITGYTTALNGLSAKQAELVLSTKGLSTAQQQAILNELSLASATGKLTTAQMTELLTTKSRSKADAEALLLNAGLITSETAEATATNVVTAAKLKELVQTKTLTQAEADLIAAKAGVTLANQKESASFLTGIGTKIKGLGSGLKSAETGILALAKAHPVIAGITTALTIGTVAVGIYKKKQEETAQAIKEAYEEAKTTIDEINSSFKNTKSSTEEIAEEYAELAQGVNLLTNENKKLSTENYERFLELSNQLSELYPSLTKGFDENGNAILDLSGDVNTIVGSLTDLVSVQEQLANQEIVKQMPALFEGYSNNVSNLNEDLETAQKTKEEIQRAYEVLNNWDSSTVWWNNGGNVSGTGTMGEYINALETLGITYKKVAVDLDNDLYHNTDGFSVEADYNQYGTELHDIYVDRFSKASDEVKYAKMQLESETSSINQYLNTWLQTEFSYNRLDDTGLQQAIQETLFNFDWSSLPKDVDKDDWDEVSEYLRRNILFSINNIDDTEVSKALSDIYTGNLTSGEMLDAITKVQSYFGESHPISLSLEPKVEDIEPLVNNVKDKLKGTEFDDRVGELSLGDLQIAADLEVPDDSIQSWDDLLERIQKVKDETFNNETAVLSFTDALAQIQSLSEGLDQLDKIYADVYDKEEFDWSSILNNDGFKEQFGEMKNVTDEYKTAYDDFIKTISDNPDDLDACQEAFDNLATAYIYNSGVLNNLTLETKDATIAMLQQMGVENAKQVVESQLALTTEEIKNTQAQLGIETANLTDLTIEQIEQLLNEGEISEYAKNQLYALYLTQIDLNANPIDTTNSINNLLKIVGASSKAGSALVELAKIMGEISKTQNFLATATGDTSLVEATLSGLESRAKLIKENATASFSTTTPAQVNYTGGSSTKSAKDKASKSAKETKETFDWIENKLESVTKKTEKLAKAFQKTFTLSSTEKKFKQYISQIDDEIKANQTAVSTYQNKLNSIGLSSDWIKKIKEGNYLIDDIVNNDELTEQINEYQTYYDKLVSAQEKNTELEEERLDAQNTYAEKVIEYQEKEMKSLEKTIDRREALIGLKEKFGVSASSSDLKYQQDKNKEQITLYDNQIDKLKELQKTVSKGSDAWNTYQEQIDSNKESVLDIIESMAELATQIANLPLDKYEKYIEENDSKSEYYNIKAENYASAKNKNKMLDKQIALLVKNNNKAQSTASTTESNLKDSISNISTANKADKKEATSAEKKTLSSYYKQVKTYTKAKKEISSSLITKISNAGFGNLAQACENYNASLIANETAKDTAKLVAETTKTEIANLQKAKFDNISSIYENKQQHIVDNASILNSKKDLATTKGYLNSQSWYNQLIALESKNKSSLKKELADLQKSLDEGLSNGSIKKNSSQWYDMVDAINATTQALEQSKIALEEYKNELRQVEFNNFDYKMEQFSRMMSEADFFKDMMSNKEMTEDGTLTEYGIASLGLSMQNYDAYLAQAQYYANEIERIKSMLADDPYDTELIAQLQEYEDAQRSALSATEAQKQAIVDLVKEGYNALINSLSDVIAEYKKMISCAKNAYDYQNTISEKAQTAESLRKQIAAYENMSGNAEIASRLQQANKELKEVEKDIQETMYDKYISDTEDVLDEMLNDLETFIEELDFEDIFNDAMETVEDNTKDIANTLNELADSYGIIISDVMKSIWANGYTPEKGFANVISKIDELITVSDKQADKVAYSEAKENYTDTSSYEKAVDSATKKVDSLNTKKNNVGTELESAKKAYDASLKKTENLQNEYNDLYAQLDISERKMSDARTQYGTKSEQYQNAKKEYEYFAMMISNVQERLLDSKAMTNQKNNDVARLQSEYNEIVTLLESAKSEKKSTESALSSVMADNKKVITTFLKAIVNYDLEKPEGNELADKVAKITNGGVLESHNMSQLATLLGCSNSESDIVKNLKKYGFATGGIVKATGEDGLVLARNGEGFVMPEHVADIQNLMDAMPNINRFVDFTLPKYDQFLPNKNVGEINITLGDMYLPDVTDANQFANSLADALQNNTKIQRILDTKVSSSMLGKNSLSVRKF